MNVLNYNQSLGQENIYYFVCKDKDGNERAGQPTGGYRVSQSEELIIQNPKCPHFENSECAGEIYENKINISIETFGGGNYGVSFCEFSLGDFAYYAFYNTNSTIHLQEEVNLLKGVNNLKFRCKDTVGNVATSNVTFNHIVDSTSPKIEKMYLKGQLFNVETSEKADCKYYTNESMNFDNATLLSADGAGLVHSIAYKEEGYSKIECRDRFGNKVGPVDTYIMREQS